MGQGLLRPLCLPFHHPGILFMYPAQVLDGIGYFRNADFLFAPGGVMSLLSRSGKPVALLLFGQFMGRVGREEIGRAHV